MIYPWHKKQWDELRANLDRLHHALLFSGPPGCGKAVFAEDFARSLLCRCPGAAGEACGVCPSCRWIEAGNHPDFRRIVPEASAESVSGEAAEGVSVARKPRSSQIRIEQIRSLGDLTSVGTHQSGRRVVVVRPAEAMNPHTANAFLKLLEEPPSSTYFILVTGDPARLLPTLRSRCRKLGFGKPDAGEAVAWLAQQGIPEPDLALRAAGGMPLEAARWADPGYRSLFDWFIGQLADGAAVDAVGVAAAWEARNRGRAEEPGGPALSTLVIWLQRWLFDLISCRMGGGPVYFAGARQVLEKIASRSLLTALFGCYNEAIAFRRVDEHPLNARLFMEDMLSRYARALPAAGSR
ncbi:MAG: DNA polymerase III subunit delta' [Betaproteobacteria bacterium CG2_30_68_42]|nr:MAG: DNA polymerase III subunit delta' [Betaproteobacteria bacterium CG2_30_68_42]PJA58604.1 MAG: DNA polymerase III subunit delta' [Rhodocyclales bacterium CG_4_9_14_3_um_filter_68_10]